MNKNKLITLLIISAITLMTSCSDASYPYVEPSEETEILNKYREIEKLIITCQIRQFNDSELSELFQNTFSYFNNADKVETYLRHIIEERYIRLANNIIDVLSCQLFLLKKKEIRNERKIDQLDNHLKKYERIFGSVEKFYGSKVANRKIRKHARNIANISNKLFFRHTINCNNEREKIANYFYLLELEYYLIDQLYDFMIYANGVNFFP